MFHIPGFHTPIPWNYKWRLEGRTLSMITTPAVSVALLAGLVTLAASTKQSPVSENMAEVRSTVASYANSWNPELDPLMPVGNGVAVKESSVNGVKIGSTRYYYRMPNDIGYDPVSRGAAKDFKVVSVLDAGTPWELIIYRLN